MTKKILIYGYTIIYAIICGRAIIDRFMQESPKECIE